MRRLGQYSTILVMKRVPLAISIILLFCCYATAQSKVDLGEVRDGVYINSGLGFTFKYPKDWVVHGEATNERISELGKEKIAAAGQSKESVEIAMQHTHYLLTVFRHPVGTPGITFNPGILVIAEQVDYAPGITNGKDYLLNLRTLLTKTGCQFLLKEPLEYRFAGAQFFRDDSTAEVNGVHLLQSHFATLKNGYALVFIFIGGDQQGLDEMTKTMETVNFSTVRRGAPTDPPPQAKPNPKP